MSQHIVPVVLSDLLVLPDRTQYPPPRGLEQRLQEPPDHNQADDADDGEHHHVGRGLTEIHRVPRRFVEELVADDLTALIQHWDVRAAEFLSRTADSHHITALIRTK